LEDETSPLESPKNDFFCAIIILQSMDFPLLNFRKVYFSKLTKTYYSGPIHNRNDEDFSFALEDSILK